MREPLRFIGLCITAAGVACAQGRGAANWTTVGYDAQRTSWLRTDPKISAESLARAGFQFLWKLKIGGELTPMVVLDPYTGYRGHKSLGFAGAAGIDIDLGIIEWQKSGHASATLCSAGPKSAVARPTSLSIQSTPNGRAGASLVAAARSGVGEPLQGATNLSTIALPRTPTASVTSAVPVRAPVVRPNVVYALSGDGMLQTLYVSNGAEAEPPIKFLPPDVGVLGLIVVDNVAYAETRGCQRRKSGLWSLDLVSKEINRWDTNNDAISITYGPAFGPDGTVYSSGGNSLATLEPKSLKPKNPAVILQSGFTSSPVVFPYGDKLLVAAATQNGGIQLSDGQKLFEAAKGDSAASALATWQDASGTRWILAAEAKGITSWKVIERNGVPTVQPGWASRYIVSPLPPIIVNGVVFAASSGKTPAILYALDGITGKELWNSGETIKSPGGFGGLSAGGSQIYLSASDGVLYAFGFPMEH